MCTALTLTTGEHYFGRTLDLDRSYGEEVCVMPRNFPLAFRQLGAMDTHYAMIGMATVVGDIPLFYEATNEHGLSVAGLNFPGNAHYGDLCPGKDNVAPFEFIPWLLGQCRSVAEARPLLQRIHFVAIPFSPQLPLSPLHWMVDDGVECLVVESMADGLHIYDNPAGVMTNNPPFPYHLFNLNHYRHLQVSNGGNHLSPLKVTDYCQGLGALGLPGDVSSMSRFVRIAFGRLHSVCESDELSSVGQFFHLLSDVSMTRGICRTPEGTWDITGYTSCCNARRGRYYYTTYGNQQITCVDMRRTDLNSPHLSRFPLRKGQSIHYEN